MADRPLLILAHGGPWEARFQATSLAASAAAAGQRVDVALFFAALAAWAADAWDDPRWRPGSSPEPPDSPAEGAQGRETTLPSAISPRRLDSLDLPPLTAMLEPGREEGAVRLLACSASVRILGLDSAAVQRRVDAVVGWPTFHRLIRRAERVITL